jgi:hypothetical protein
MSSILFRAFESSRDLKSMRIRFVTSFYLSVGINDFSRHKKGKEKNGSYFSATGGMMSRMRSAIFLYDFREKKLDRFTKTTYACCARCDSERHRERFYRLDSV